MIGKFLSMATINNYFLEILALGRPFSFSVDSLNRTMFSCNFDAIARSPVYKWEESIVKILSTKSPSLSTSPLLGVNTFIGPLPVNNSASLVISLMDTGGSQSEFTQNDEKYEQLSLQIIVISLGFQSGRDLALEIWQALDGIRNKTVSFTV